MRLFNYYVGAVFVIGFTGTFGLSSKAFAVLKEPDKERSLLKSSGRSVYNLKANQEVVDEVVQEIERDNFINDAELRRWLQECKPESSKDKNDDFGKLNSLTRLDDTADTSNQDDSLLDKGLRYLKGLLTGDDDSTTDNDRSDTTSSTQSPEDESIMEDIEKYLEGVADPKNGTFHQILNYIVSYVHRNVHFWLFTRDQKGYEDLSMGRISNVSKSDFSQSKKTIMFIHGWVNGGDNNYAKFMIDAFEKYGDFNLISVDWSELSYSFYTISRLSVNFVGPYVAQMIDFLAKHHDVKVSQLHVLGHSLGAHIAGIAGLFVKNGKIGRITGFDPARPLFGDDKKYRLDASDAKFVDVIHTSFLGMPDALGHADFYPNGGGPSQPGCSYNLAICPHRRSYKYFIESMTNNNFLAYSCNSWDSFVGGNCTTRYTHMGIHASRRRRGKFYLRTAAESPFALGIKTLDPVEDEQITQSKVKRPLQHKPHSELY